MWVGEYCQLAATAQPRVLSLGYQLPADSLSTHAAAARIGRIRLTFAKLGQAYLTSITATPGNPFGRTDQEFRKVW
jgi:hypothetical protein